MNGKEINIQGYLECNGNIVKISSIEDIEIFLLKYGNSTLGISENDLDEMTTIEGETIIDDCGVTYLSNPKALKCGVLTLSYKISEGTIAISKNAFRLNKEIHSVYIPDSVICIGETAFYYNESLSNLRLSKSIIKIGDYAFGYCNKITSFILPSSLRIIGKGAFLCCGMTDITIPDSVNKIGAFAFSDNAKLNSVLFEGIPDKISSGIFDRCPALEKVYVPTGSKEYFEKALFPLEKEKIIEQFN